MAFLPERNLGRGVGPPGHWRFVRRAQQGLWLTSQKGSWTLQSQEDTDITCSRKEEELFQSPGEKGPGTGHKTVHKAGRCVGCPFSPDLSVPRSFSYQAESWHVPVLVRSVSSTP